MLLDPEVQRVSADAVWLVGEATRLFLHALAAKGAAAVSAKKRKTIMLQDFDTLVRCAVHVAGGGGVSVLGAQLPVQLSRLWLCSCHGPECSPAAALPLITPCCPKPAHSR